jgi:flagellar hook-length control protein FliK
VNVNFDVAIGGGPGPLPPPPREETSDKFGEALQGALEHADDSSRDTAVDRRSRASRDQESDPRESSADKDRETDATATTDVVTLGLNGELVRPMPVPPPQDQNDTGTTAEGEQNVEATADLTQAFALLERPADGTTASPAAQTEEATKQTALRNQRGTRGQAADKASNLSEISGDVATNLAAILQQMAGGSASDPATAAGNRLSEGAWRRVMVARLSNLIESSPSDRTNSLPGARGSAPQLPAVAELNKALAAIASQASAEQKSTVAKAFGASSIAEMFEAERHAGLDRHALTQLNPVRIESSMLTPLQLTTGGTSAETVAVEQQTIDTDLPEQIVQSIRVQALDLGGEARVRLRPEYLGEVVVSVKVDGGAVTATLQADTAAVRRWIETHEVSLRMGLAEHGLHLDRLIVSEPAKSESEPEERRRQSPQEQPAQQESRRSPRNEEEPGTFEVVV